MAEELWAAVDQYIDDHLVRPDPVLDETRHANAAAGLPTIDVTPSQGKLLHLLARMQGATRILEIGTLGGYSTIWLARALPPDGKLLTLELDPHHAEVAASNLARAGLTSLVEIKLGPALETLSALHAQGESPFDLIFIDADKPNNSTYLACALRLSRAGTLIIVDNIVRDGEIVGPDHSDPRVDGARKVFEMLQAEPRLDATAVQTVGSKGYDGFILALVIGVA